MKALVLCGDEVLEFVSSWEIGASGAHTKTTGIPGTGFTGVARTGAGQYTITFQRNMPVGPLVDLKVSHWPQANAAPLVASALDGGFTAETAAAAATALYETMDLETPARTELPNGDRVTITARFLKTKVV